MKYNKLLGLFLFVTAGASCLASCGETSISTVEEFSFTAALESGKKTITLGTTDKIVVTTNGVATTEQPKYKFISSKPAIATVDEETGYITTLKTGKVNFTVTEVNTLATFSLMNIEVLDDAPKANGGYNFASSSGAEAISTRTEILGKLEKYAMDSHLTGITLFENGGYVKYSERAFNNLPTQNYVTGYGFGLLSEGAEFTTNLPNGSPTYSKYYHAAQSQDPLTINHLNATGSQVGDLAGYITSTYFGTKLNEDKTNYVWYPVLAKDTVDGKAQTRPEPQGAKNDLGLYTKWRIYVKTGDSDGIKYRAYKTSGANVVENETFNNRKVALQDYEFIFKFLLTGSNKLKRGAEMAGDTSYGIKGAQRFYNNTKTMTDVALIDAEWENSNIGLKTGTDQTKGAYIEFDLLNPIDEFTAMYTLSSSLYSPLPRDFILGIGNGSYKTGAEKYGKFNSEGDNGILNYTICCGPYYLDRWVKKQQTVFTLNEDWFEAKQSNRYNIKGVNIRVISTENDEEAVWKAFCNGELDSSGIPQKQITAQKTAENVLQTKGDSTFKLNVNSCSQSFWDYQFGSKGKICKGSNWEVKPWMSNDNFLKGLFYSINRPEFAAKRGVQPSINYFSNAYLSDPENGYSYNDTDAHKEAVKDYQTYAVNQQGNVVNTYGFNKDKAIECFKAAINELKATGQVSYGTASEPEEIKIHIRWMYTTDVTEYGEDIASYIESAFNDRNVCNGRIKLKIEQEGVTNWEDVYNEWMMKGQFDLAFGAISGNTYNPLNFLEVLKSNNSSGFTLNWGTDTSKVDTVHPLIYKGKAWSFDALYEVADHGGVVENGCSVKSVKSIYMDNPTKLTGEATNDFTGGMKVKIPVSFVSVDDVEFSLDQEQGAKVEIYVFGARNISVDYTVENNVITVTVSAEKAQEINDLIRETYKLREEDNNVHWEDYLKMFTYANYGQYWTIEVYYNLTVAGGQPVQNYVTVEKNAESHIYNVD